MSFHLSAYVLYGRATGNTQTSSGLSYSIEIRSLNSSMSVNAGSTVDFMFNVTSPVVGPLYFYASDVPAPGSHTTLNLQNVTTGNIELPPGVQVSYPTGQAVFGTSHAILTLRVTFAPTVNGTVGLAVPVHSSKGAQLGAWGREWLLYHSESDVTVQTRRWLIPGAPE